ncbi:MAG: hypothetical protein KGH60_04340 [Candidatus Micrarchaeota archaeon]|nr:hypothetical protein [Candidatus Micrarchaeota archaeon]
MPVLSISAAFEPNQLKAFKRTDAVMKLAFANSNAEKAYWCECDISVKSPLSLAPDKELGKGRAKVGIIMPGKSREKPIKLYTTPNNFAGDYDIKMTVYVYDEDGAIAERFEKVESIKCLD